MSRITARKRGRRRRRRRRRPQRLCTTGACTHHSACVHSSARVHCIARVHLSARVKHSGRVHHTACVHHVPACTTVPVYTTPPGYTTAAVCTTASVYTTMPAYTATQEKAGDEGQIECAPLQRPNLPTCRMMHRLLSTSPLPPTHPPYAPPPPLETLSGKTGLGYEWVGGWVGRYMTRVMWAP